MPFEETCRGKYKNFYPGCPAKHGIIRKKYCNASFNMIFYTIVLFIAWLSLIFGIRQILYVPHYEAAPEREGHAGNQATCLSYYPPHASGYANCLPTYSPIGISIPLLYPAPVRWFHESSGSKPFLSSGQAAGRSILGYSRVSGGKQSLSVRAGR
jgi:hypothetical protein